MSPARFVYLLLCLALVTLTLPISLGQAAPSARASVLAAHEEVPVQTETTPAVELTATPAPIALAPPYSAQTPLPATGRAMYYNPGVMGQVLAYRLKHKQVHLCGDCVGYAALLRAGDLNRRVWLQWEDGAVDGPFLVIDVAAHHHIPSLLERDWVVDVDYRSAQRRGMNRPLPVTVLAAPPPASEPEPQDLTWSTMQLANSTGNILLCTTTTRYC